MPLYGGALTGEIVYMENNKLGCNVFAKPLVPVTLPVFLLVDRGDCYFVEKVCKSSRHYVLHPATSALCCAPTFEWPGAIKKIKAKLCQ